MAVDAGYKSIISQYNLTTNATVGSENLYETEILRHIAEDLGGLHFEVVLEPGEAWAKVSTVERFTAALLRSPAPVLFYCNSAFSASFVALSYFLNQSRLNPEFEPRLDSVLLYERGASLGFNYDRADLKAIVAEISGEDEVDEPAVPDVSSASWTANHMWVVTPVYRNWYSAGQIRSSYLHGLEANGYDTVINVRLGTSTPPDNEPSQEEVPLTNIHDGTGTYENGGRQSTQRLLETRIDDNRPGDYVEFGSEVNYQSRNPLEFGDDVGYNEDAERSAMASALEATYVHTPIGRVARGTSGQH